MSDDRKLAHAPLDAKIDYFSDWEFRMKILLQAKNCYSAVVSDCPANDDHRQQAAFDSANAKAVSQIVRHLSSYGKYYCLR